MPVSFAGLVPAIQGERGVKMMRAILPAALMSVTAALPPSPALASAEDLVTIETQCGKRLNLPPGGCTCLRDKASELTEGQVG
jgi:hypothetical protein